MNVNQEFHARAHFGAEGFKAEEPGAEAFGVDDFEPRMSGPTLLKPQAFGDIGFGAAHFGFFFCLENICSEECEAEDFGDET